MMGQSMNTANRFFTTVIVTLPIFINFRSRKLWRYQVTIIKKAGVERN
jgi:hypothetical protein